MRNHWLDKMKIKEHNYAKEHGLPSMQYSPDVSVIVNRKFRFTITFFENDEVIIPRTIVKVKKRPVENEFSYNYWDYFKDDGSFQSDDITKLIGRQYKLIETGNQDPTPNLKAELELWDGCGNLLEEWIFKSFIFKELNFGCCGDLDLGVTISYSDVPEYICRYI